MMSYVESTIGNKNSVVILMHDIGTKKSTYELLPQLIQVLKDKGYVFENIYDILKWFNKNRAKWNNALFY